MKVIAGPQEHSCNSCVRAKTISEFRFADIVLSGDLSPSPSSLGDSTGYLYYLNALSCCDTALFEQGPLIYRS